MITKMLGCRVPVRSLCGGRPEGSKPVATCEIEAISRRLPSGDDKRYHVFMKMSIVLVRGVSEFASYVRSAVCRFRHSFPGCSCDCVDRTPFGILSLHTKCGAAQVHYPRARGEDPSCCFCISREHHSFLRLSFTYWPRHNGDCAFWAAARQVHGSLVAHRVPRWS